MAVVGSANIIVRAVTTGVRNDIRRGFAGVDGEGRRAGQRIGKAFQGGFLREAERAYQKFRALSAVGFIVAPAIAGVAAALSSVVSGLFAFGSQMAAAVPAALALAGALSALLQAALAVKFAMGGVGAAISAGLAAGGGGGGGGMDMSSYYDRIEDARRNLAMTLERAAESEERAQRAVTEAYEDYQDAIVDTTRAVDAYKRAQKEAAEQTQQLNFDVEDAALSQERAAMALEEARRRLAAVADLPVDSAARREAELAFKEADLNYRRAADTNADLKQEQEEAVAAGSAGADDLVDASNDVREAKEAEADAFRRYQDAIIDAERTRRDAQRDILEAEEALLDALEALEKAGAGGGGGVDAFAAAMAKLSPEAQDFVRYIISIQDEIKNLRAAAGKALFPKLIQSLKMIVSDVFPVLEKGLFHTGNAVGDFALSLSRALTQTKNLKALERVMITNSGVIRTFGAAAGDLLTIIIQLLDSARPLTREFAGWIRSVAGGWKDLVETNKATGELGRTLEYAGEVAKQLGDVFGNVMTAFGNLGKAAAGPGSGGEMLLNTFQDATQRFEDFTEAIGADGTAEAFFMNAAENLKSISTTVVKIVKGFIELGDNGGVKQFFDSINESGGAIDSFFSALEKIIGGNVGDIMGDVANNIAKIIDAFAESGSIEIFFSILKSVSGALASFFSNETVQKILPIVAAIHAISSALWLILLPIKFLGKAWIGLFVAMAGPVKFLVGAFTMLNAKLLQMLAFASYGSGPLAGIAGALAGMGALPLLAIAAGIAAIVAVFVMAYKNSEKLRDSISELVSSIGGALLSAWESIKSGFEDAIGSINRVFDGVGGLSGVFRMVGDALSVLVGLISAQWSGIIKFIGATIGAVVRIIGSVLGGALNFIKGIFQGISSALGGMGDGVKNAGSFFDGLKKAVTTFWNVASTVVTWLSTAYSWVYDNFVSPIMNIVGRLLGYIIGFVAKIAIAINPITYIIKGVIAVFGMARDFIMQYWDQIVQAIEDSINIIIDGINLLIDAFNKVAGVLGMDAIEPLTHVDFSATTQSAEEMADATKSLGDEAAEAASDVDKVTEATNKFNDALNAGNALITYEESLDSLNEMFKKNIKEIDFSTKKGREYGKQILTNVSNIGDQVDAMDSVTKKTRVASEGLDVLTEGLKDTKMPPATRQALIDAMQGIIDKVKAAGGDTTELQKKLDKLKSKDITVTVKGVWDGTGLPPGATPAEWHGEANGGLIRGPGTGTSDSIPRMLSNGEFVIRAASVRKFGVGLFESLNSGAMPEAAQSRGAVMTATAPALSAPVTVNVYPSAGMDERQLAQRVSRVIAQQMRKGGA